MRFKDIRKGIWDIAFKLAISSCGGECGECGICQNPYLLMPQDERQSCGSGTRVVKGKSGGDGMR